MNPVDIAEPLRSRWSPSVFDARHELTAAEITRLLEAAQWAPSSGNRQPWRFVVAPRGSAQHAAFVPHLSRGNSGWVPRASVVLLSVVMLGQDGVELSDVLIPTHDVGQAAAHLTLQARAMGLHAHQFGGFDHDGAAEALGIPDTARLLAGIAVGVRGNPAEVSERDAERDHRERQRRPLAETAYGAWGEAWPGLTPSGPTVADRG
ncbi:nitroreductase family protein [Nocardioides nitrophenolicus]|uniref:nitroreductase family protein n=1 Tax=Nocardioides nitrophenolicus TaxID=60489 RepID=UPI00195AE14C|nr:nitroreductase family protein [Nocardioides nitrophenolicus]MBM7517447.1 nitroreductase [Nocardioides nitrophenolicus]